MNIQLTNVEIIILILGLLAVWTAWTSSNTLATMGQAGNPSTPQAALGQAAINGTIGCLTILVIGLSLAGAAYFFLRRPNLPLPGLYVGLVSPETAQSPLSYPPLSPGGQAEVVVDSGIPLYRADAAGQPTEGFVTQLWRGQLLEVVAGPGELGGRVVWKVRTPQGVEGWAPLLTPSGGLALAPR